MSSGPGKGLKGMDTPDGTAPGLDLEPAARQIRELIGAVDDRQLAGPTPCPDYSVRELLGHLGADRRLPRRGAQEVRPDDRHPSDSGAAGTARRLAHGTAAPAGRAGHGWRSPDALEGMTRAGGVDLPGQVAGMVARNELVVHGWDLARSTGQDFRADEASLRSSEALLAPGDDDRSGPDAIFGPPVPVAADAPLVDRVIALSGRRPDWLPGG